MNVVLVTGSRIWTDYRAVYDCLAKQPAGTIVLQGGCRTGADFMAHHAALKLGFMPLTLFPNWDVLGHEAGPIRNRAMAEVFKRLCPGPEFKAYAFLLKSDPNKGTRNCIAELKKLGIVAEEIEG